MGFRCRLSLLKSRDFCGFVHGMFSGSLDVLNDLARQLLSAIIRTSEHFHVFSTLLRLSVRMFGRGRAGHGGEQRYDEHRQPHETSTSRKPQTL
jgi:hypothetical protein